MTDESSYEMWSDGMLRCCVDSPVQRLSFGNDAVYPMPRSDKKLPDIHTQVIIDPMMVERAALDVRHEMERRLLFQLVEYGVGKHVWPTAPVISWQVWSAQQHRWYGIHWPPKPPSLLALTDESE